jgi:3-hydroxymyristoyl/3-hydroxydecanoyl-(acyl carrier protein) dehydratase
MTIPPTTLTIPKNDPAFVGHFPNAPVYPGAQLIDHVVRHAVTATGRSIPALSRIKFTAQIGPGETITIDYEDKGSGRYRFTIRRADEVVAVTGTLTIASSATEPVE